jgi:lipopolysaccharide exporter
MEHPEKKAAEKKAEEGLGHKVAVGSFWTMLMRFGIRGIGFISTIILARLLAPEDFGIIAMAMIVAGGLEAMSEFGISTFLITKQHSDDQYYNTAWTMNIIRSTIIAVIVALLAPWTAEFFNEPHLTIILYFISFGAFIHGFENVGVINFQKEFKFSKDFKWMVSTKLIGFVVTITAAWFLRNYWALIAGMLAARSTRVILSFYMHSYRPKISLTRWREIFGFSKWLVMSNILGFLRHQGDRFILAKLANVNTMGIYAVAWEIANLPTSELIAPIRRALLPAFSTISDDKVALRNAYLNTIEMIIFIVSPVAVGLILVADQAIPVLLGDKWISAAPIVQILVIGGLFQASTAPAGTVFLAVGKPKINVILNVISSAVLFPAAIIGGINYGVTGIAWATVLAAAVLAICSQLFVTHSIGVTIGNILVKIWRTIISLGIMVACVWWFGDHIINEYINSTPKALIANILVGIISFITIDILFWLICGKISGPEEKLLNFTFNIIDKKFKPNKNNSKV